MGREVSGGKGTGNKNNNGRYKIDRGRLRIVWEMEKPRTYMYDPWTWTKVGEWWWERGCRVEGNKGEKKWDNCNCIINKIYFKNVELLGIVLAYNPLGSKRSPRSCWREGLRAGVLSYVSPNGNPGNKNLLPWTQNFRSCVKVTSSWTPCCTLSLWPRIELAT